MINYNVIPLKNPIDKTTKYYGQVAPVIAINMNELCEVISNQCTVTAHDVKGVLSALEEQVYTAMRNGRSVRLGDLGSFHPTLSSATVSDSKLFDAKNIKSVNCRFTPSARMAYEMSVTHPAIKFKRVVQETPQTDGGDSDSAL